MQMNNMRSTDEMTLYLPLPMITTFNLTNVVCSHGFFMMAPNIWDAETKTLQRPFRLLSDSTTSLTVSISHNPPSAAPNFPAKNTSTSANFLSLKVHGTNSLSRQDERFILDQVARMLHISEEDERKIEAFHQMHPDAKNKGFGRVFRSPTLFEDMVKIILLGNTSFGRTVGMSRDLCVLQLKLKNGNFDPKEYSSSSSSQDQNPNNLRHPAKSPRKTRGRYLADIEKKRKMKYKMITASNNVDDAGVCNSQSSSSSKEHHHQRSYGDFPSPKELMNLEVEDLNESCKLGPRAAIILNLARKFDKLQVLLDTASTSSSAAYYDQVYKKLMLMKGIGPFTASYVLTCMGFYEKIPADTETLRHLRMIHGKKDCTKKTMMNDAEKIYGKYAPFQFLAYWSEIWNFYENKFGKLSELPPEKYKIVTGSFNSNQGDAMEVVDKSVELMDKTNPKPKLKPKSKSMKKSQKKKGKNNELMISGASKEKFAPHLET